jgi:hypothetical protein
MDKDLKIYLVSHLGPAACWRLVVASNAEEAFLQCAHDGQKKYDAKMGSCKIEEITFDGYEVDIRKVES